MSLLDTVHLHQDARLQGFRQVGKSESQEPLRGSLVASPEGTSRVVL